jgi:hypothetical protein
MNGYISSNARRHGSTKAQVMKDELRGLGAQFRDEKASDKDKDANKSKDSASDRAATK